MFDRVKALLQGEAPPPVAAWRDDDAEVAAAALLIEAARVDGRIDPLERATIVGLLGGRFGLDPASATALMELGARANERSAQLHRFAHTLNQHCSEAERIELIEMLWAVVYADGALSAYEANLLRRIGGLLYVDDRDRGAARKRVLARRPDRPERRQLTAVASPVAASSMACATETRCRRRRAARGTGEPER